MKTITLKEKLKMKNSIKWLVISSSVFVSALFMNNYSTKANSIDAEKMENLSRDDVNDWEFIYNEIYNEIYENLNDYDSNYEELVSDGTVVINDVCYPVSKIVLFIDAENIVHVVDAEKNDSFDLLKNYYYKARNVRAVLFNKSSIFSKLYDDKLFNDNNIELTDDIYENYISKWDGNKAIKTRSEIAGYQSNVEFRKRVM